MAEESTSDNESGHSDSQDKQISRSDELDENMEASYLSDQSTDLLQAAEGQSTPDHPPYSPIASDDDEGILPPTTSDGEGGIRLFVSSGRRMFARIDASDKPSHEQLLQEEGRNSTYSMLSRQMDTSHNASSLNSPYRLREPAMDLQDAIDRDSVPSSDDEEEAHRMNINEEVDEAIGPQEQEDIPGRMYIVQCLCGAQIAFRPPH